MSAPVLPFTVLQGGRPMPPHQLGLSCPVAPVREPLSTAGVRTRLLTKLDGLDGEQLQIVEIVIGAIVRGVK